MSSSHISYLPRSASFAYLLAMAGVLVSGCAEGDGGSLVSATGGGTATEAGISSLGGRSNGGGGPGSGATVGGGESLVGGASTVLGTGGAGAGRPGVGGMPTGSGGSVMLGAGGAAKGGALGLGGTGSSGGPGTSSCRAGVQTGDTCNPDVDATECVRSTRTCTCAATNKWNCTPLTGSGGSNMGSGGSNMGSGGSNVGSGGSNVGSGGSNVGSGGSNVGSGGSTGGGGLSTRRFVGNITTNGQVRSDFKNYWDQITPENEGKWESVEGSRDNMNWSGLEAVRTYAKENGILFKQHTFVWGSQYPRWIEGLGQAEQRAEVEEWIKAFCDKFGDDAAIIDVVNEPPPHTSPPFQDALGGAGESGWDWIVQSFKWARQYCPNSILVLNDYNNIEYGDQVSHFADIAKAVLKAGGPIDALGCQAHDAYKLSTSVVQGHLKTLEAIGLPMYITEYDIGIADDNQQKAVMEEQFTMFWNDPKIVGITYWGYINGSTWRSNTGIMQSNGTMRPAMTWLMDFLKR